MLKLNEGGVIKQLSPPTIRADPFTAALSDGLEKELNLLQEEAMLLTDFVNPDTLPDELLNHLAFDKLLEYYFILTIDEKRNLIRNAKRLKRIKGTVSALEAVLKILNLEGKVQEWFEYSGEPGYIKVEVDVSTRGIQDDIYNLLDMLISAYKRKSTWLENLHVRLASNSKIHMAVASFSGEEIKIYPYSVTNITTKGSVYFGTAQGAMDSTIVYPKGGD